jgi:hypothetical protein
MRRIDLMAKQILQYSAMVEAALRAVVRQSLSEVAESGLPGNHHFYITFRTSYPGVQVPDYLRARYPSEMTIVLQFQFYDLTVDDSAFSVTLTFNNAPERLVIPLRAITVFADPSVNFALPFQPVEPFIQETVASAPLKAAPVKTATLKPPSSRIKQAKTEKTEPVKNAGPGKNTGEVVSLDQFRRK